MQESGFNHRRLGFVFFAELPGGATKVDRFHCGVLIDFGHPCFGHTHVDMFFEFSSILKFGICVFFLHSKNVRRTFSVSAVLRATASCAKLESLNQNACWLLISGESKLAKSSKHPFQMFTTRRHGNGQTESNLPYLMTRGYPGGKHHCHGCICRSCTTESSICERQGIVLGVLCYSF